jgi:hypothetical protein
MRLKSKEDLIYKYIGRISVAKLRLESNYTPHGIIDFGVKCIYATVRLRNKMNGKPKKETIIGGITGGNV